MHRRLTRLATFSLLALGLSLAACADDDAGVLGAGEDDVSGTQTLETLDLDQAYGGLAYTDEAAAFGDQEMLMLAESGDALALAEDEEDSLVDDDPTLESPTFQHAYLRILWGRLDGDFDPETRGTMSTLLDWSGSITVSDGAVALKRTILFERPYDHRLPRDSRDSLAWVSHTGPHFDGILVKVISPLVDGVPQGTVTFETPRYRTTLSVSELDDLELQVDVDEQGNAVSLQGQVFEPTRCAAGFVNGFWRGGEDRPETEAVEMGGFRGRYVSQNGLATGHLRGVYGMDSSGERVLFGKFIGRDGRIRGLVAGTWQPAEDGSGMGSFQARWVNRNGAIMGTLEGRYRRNADDQIGDGFFEGRWRERCTAGA